MAAAGVRVSLTIQRLFCGLEKSTGVAKKSEREGLTNTNSNRIVFYMKTIANMNRAELEVEILADDSLYASLDEARLLSGGYSDDELRAAVEAWILAGDECGGAS